MKLNFHILALILVVVTATFAPEISFSQTLSFDLAEDNITSGTAAGNIFRIIAILTVLSLAPSILMMVTSFTRIIIVLSLLRSAIGIQQTPPNIVLISLALFLTLFIMQPVFERSYEEGLVPLMAEELDEVEAVKKMAQPFHDFMMIHVRSEDLNLFISLSEGENDEQASANSGNIVDDVPYKALIPAFMISELRRAFEIGFLIFIPFLIIDMVVASTLMSMGMMMLPPVLISLPFKIIFFVLIDGWAMLSESLVKSFL